MPNREDLRIEVEIRSTISSWNLVSYRWLGSGRSKTMIGSGSILVAWDQFLTERFPSGESQSSLIMDCDLFLARRSQVGSARVGSEACARPELDCSV